MVAMPTSRTIPGLLDELAARFPEREALVGGGQRYTYAALREEVRAFAKGLHALGVRKGKMVAILMGNKPEWVVADLAICSLGGTMVAVNTWVTTRELGYVLAHSDATALIACDRFLRYDYFAMLDELAPLAHPRHGLTTLSTWARVRTATQFRSTTSTHAAALCRMPRSNTRRAPSTQKTSLICFTHRARPRRLRACSFSITR